MMKAIEFKSKLKNNTIHIPQKIQAELKNSEEKDVRVMIFLEEENEANNLDKYPENEAIVLAKDELDSISRGLKDVEEGKIHSNETARKIYGKYL